MSDKPVSTSVDILGKPYTIKCPESQLESLQKAAAYLDAKMKEVQESGKAINLERIAIITALNMAYDFLQINHQKEGVLDKINQRIVQLQNKIEDVIVAPAKQVGIVADVVNQMQQTELIYTAE